MSSDEKRLDDSTLQVVAEVICGQVEGFSDTTIEKSPYRTMSEICRFFNRAGVKPKGESSTRYWFVLQSLQAANGIELINILLRLANPKEYRGNAETTKKIIDYLNKVLIAEGIEISLLGVEPRLRLRSPELREEISNYKITSPPDFQKIVDPELAGLLTLRWEEAQKNICSGSYLSALIMMGSLLEGVLLAKIEKIDSETFNVVKHAPKKKDGKVKPLQEWSLHDLIEVSHELGLLGGSVKRFSHTLREYRNMVHPFYQRTLSENPDINTCRICWEVVKAAISDLFGEKS